MSRLFHSAVDWKTVKVVVCLVGSAVLAALGLHQDLTRDRQLIRTPEPVMGVAVSLFLFDMRAYERELLPAYRSFVEKSDPKPLVSILEQVLPTLQNRRGLLIRPSEVYQEYADILNGKVYYSSSGEERKEPRRALHEDLRRFVDSSVAPAVLRLVCVPPARGFDPAQDMSRPGLMKYLYHHSRWIEDYFTFAKEPSGPDPAIKLGEWSRLFSADEIKTFNEELSRLARPSDPEALRDGFDNLRDLVRAATQEADLSLLVSVL